MARFAARGWDARQLSELSLPLRDVVEASDGALLVQGAGRVWRFSADGRQREAFGALEDADALAACGAFVLIKSERSDGMELAIFDVDGSRRSTVAAGDLYVPACSPDGRAVYYLDFVPTEQVWRASVDGGEPVPLGPVLGDAIASRISVSADGKIYAYAYSEFEPTPRTRFGLFPAEGGPPLRVIDLPGSAVHGSAGSPLLSPDARSVEYVITQHGVENVWEQSLDGGGRRQLTRFTTGTIFDFNWSRDGRTLLLTRGDSSSDAVLIGDPGSTG